jgi:Fur family peroxide stress response transcriptional regulator
MKTEVLAEKLRENGIQPSLQRIMILGDLIQAQDHPTAATIHARLLRQQGQISLATVYNTLMLLAKKGLVRVLSNAGGELRYDANMIEHGHFCCQGCGKVSDVGVEVRIVKPDVLGDCEVRHTDVYLSGLCGSCRRQG